ncbi:flagella biosynthesis chaperone for FliD, FliT [Shewanella sp. GXUN23E]|uniref:flagella biosynthesis chaperone for FliD, FliT n=1 Tax=Shewanella sp. GXUN23E TaxID=3422498 RepID=UPI003D7CCF62
MQALDNVNTAMAELFSQLASNTAEDASTDMLVSDLQELVNKRQLLLDELLADDSFTDRQYLQQQLELTRSFARDGAELRAHRQSLLCLGSKSKRQVNVYKAIDADR